MDTKFTLIKNNLTTNTRNIATVVKLQKLGWKVKQSELSNYI